MLLIVWYILYIICVCVHTQVKEGYMDFMYGRPVNGRRIRVHTCAYLRAYVRILAHTSAHRAAHTTCAYRRMPAYQTFFVTLRLHAALYTTQPLKSLKILGVLKNS